MRLARIREKAFRTDLRTDGWTDGRTNPFIEMLGASKNHDAIFTRFVESTWFHVFLLLLRYQPAPQYPWFWLLVCMCMRIHACPCVCDYVWVFLYPSSSRLCYLANFDRAFLPLSVCVCVFRYPSSSRLCYPVNFGRVFVCVRERERERFSWYSPFGQRTW